MVLHSFWNVLFRFLFLKKFHSVDLAAGEDNPGIQEGNLMVEAGGLESELVGVGEVIKSRRIIDGFVFDSTEGQFLFRSCFSQGQMVRKRGNGVQIYHC